nr:unnamed protein product [Spirometra erinaceieuropaei]
MLRSLFSSPYFAQVLSFARVVPSGSAMLRSTCCQSFMQRRRLTTQALSSNILRQERLEALLERPQLSENLKQLLALFGDEPTMPAGEGVSLLDLRIVRPLSETARLSPTAICNLLEVVLAPSLQSFYGRSSVSPQTRLELLSPDFVLRHLIHPLSRFGVGDPVRAISRCPGLFAAAIMREEGEDSRLVAALKTLSTLLSRKDLATLVKKFPEALTRSPDELLEIYTYLTEKMGLASSSEVHSAARHPHEMRHSTKLLISACSAWRLPLNKTVARHTLLLLANQWPPKFSDSKNISRDNIVSQLLACPPARFSHWLQSCGLEEAELAAESHCVQTYFSAEDVRIFEAICSNLTSMKSVNTTVLSGDLADSDFENTDDEEEYDGDTPTG